MIRLRFGTTILQVRRAAVCIGAACVLVCFGAVYVYFSRLLPSSTGLAGWPPGKVDMAALEQRLQRLEKELRNNHIMLTQIRDTVRNFLTGAPGMGWKGIPKAPPALQNVSRTAIALSPADCFFCNAPPAITDYNVYDLYEKIAFDNPDGGVWKQGWKLEYEESMWTKDRKLRVFVVPHSHNDPGWLKTFDKYYLDQTRHILDNMAAKLGVDKRRRFIWAETSYLSHWFDQQSEEIKSKVRNYVQSGQLEIVTGGWVMNDEANTHVFAMLEQMVEGHQWVERNLGVRPRNGWAIDPFGLSSTMPYLLKRMGFTNMVVQRVHYSVKKYMARERALEFIWRQPWDQNKTTDILCHMMPFYSYDVPHTCGPDPKVCCQFDFKRLPGNKINCPWKVPPVAITDQNVADRAMLLLDQYRKKSLLFRTHVVLVPLGDDFRYDKPSEWDNQFNNYQKLFDYINVNERLHAEVQFGTLDDYFTALRAESTVDSSNMPIGFPSLSGDFFTYADRDDNYWSGYYTSRPFYKNMDRTVEAHLRGAEIMFSLVWARMGYICNDYMPLVNSMMNGLVYARQNLGLFQHHDGITGTAKNPVVIDYGVRLFKSLQNLREIITKGALYMLLNAPSQGGIEDDLFVLQMDDVRDTHDGMPHKQLLSFTREGRIRYVVFYNSLTVPRNEIVSLQVSTARSSSEAHLSCPLWFDVPPLGLATYRVEHIEGISGMVFRASVTLYNTVSGPDTLYFPIARSESREDFRIQTPYLAATFSPTTGMLKHVLVKDQNISLDVESVFVKYGTRPKNKDRSGAYLFLPDDKARELVYDPPYIRVTEGVLFSEVVVFLPNVDFTVRVKNSPGIDGVGLDIKNVVDITKSVNEELVMRLKTGVHNVGPEFYTDVNGLLMAKRHTLAKLTLQGNVYPMPSMMFIQDNSTRLSLLSGQPLGTTSLYTGLVDVFLDRRLNQDDKRGACSKVSWITSRRRVSSGSCWRGFPQNLRRRLQLSVTHPFWHTTHPSACCIHSQPQWVPNQSRPGPPSNTTAMFLHRLPHDCRLRSYAMRCTQQTDSMTTLADMFPEYFGPSVEETTLSLLRTISSTSTKTSRLNLPSPAEMAAYKLQRR
ncbi:hypothetical protein MTO96_003395 [Rhipicephalus appendiculatus]